MKKENPVFYKEKPRDLSSEELGDLLSIKIRNGASWNEIADKIKLGIWIKFIVTKKRDIVLGSYSDSHRYIMETSGLEKIDLDIDNGLVREDEDAGGLIFSYQSSPMTPLHHAAEKKILFFLRSKGLKISDKYKHPSYQ